MAIKIVMESQHRRLAPQRKTIPTQAPAAAPSVRPVLDPDHPPSDSAATINGDVLSNIAINTPSTSQDQDGYRYDYVRGYEDDDENEYFSPILTNNVADWTTTFMKQSHSHGDGNDEPCNIEDEEVDDAQYGFELESSTSHSTNDDEFSGDDDENENQNLGDIFHIITEEHISLNPPPTTLPYILVNLESLCGCQVGNRNEKQVLLKQLTETLLGSSTSTEDKCEEAATLETIGVGLLTNHSNSNVLGDGLSLDFDERVIDLFGSDVASHVDSSYPIAISCMSEADVMNSVEARETITPYALVPYPEFLAEQSHHKQQHQLTNATRIAPPKLLRSTIRLWKLLHTVPTQQPDISLLLSRIFVHLRNTSRSLLWKASMHYEISILAKEEYILHTKREQRQEYYNWKENVRGARLQKLYEVRETFLLQVEMARKRHDSLVEEREGRVENELRRRGLLSEVNSSILPTNEKLLDSKRDNIVGDDVFDDVDPWCDDDGWGGTVNEDEIIGEDICPVLGMVHEDDEDGNDEWSPLNVCVNPLGMNVTVDGSPMKDATDTIIGASDNNTIDVECKASLNDKPSNNSNKLEPISHDDNLQRKTHRLQKRNEADQLLPSANFTTHQRQEYLRREQDSIRESLKTTDERIAEATLLKLEERLQNVDDLLEKLQEEEWADEEAGDDGIDEEVETSDLNDIGTHVDEAEERSSLLDNILAMILGALPRDMSSGGESTVTDDAYYRHIKDEHDSIVQEWIRVFGRLPPFPSSEPEVTEQPNNETELLESYRLLGGLQISGDDNDIVDNWDD